MLWLQRTAVDAPWLAGNFRYAGRICRQPEDNVGHSQSLTICKSSAIIMTRGLICELFGLALSEVPGSDALQLPARSM